MVAESLKTSKCTLWRHFLYRVYCPGEWLWTDSNSTNGN